MGEPLTLTKDGFESGNPATSGLLRWIHVTELIGARSGAFKACACRGGEWRDPNSFPTSLHRLNHALVHAGPRLCASAGAASPTTTGHPQRIWRSDRTASEHDEGAHRLAVEGGGATFPPAAPRRRPEQGAGEAASPRGTPPSKRLSGSALKGHRDGRSKSGLLAAFGVN